MKPFTFGQRPDEASAAHIYVAAGKDADVHLFKHFTIDGEEVEESEYQSWDFELEIGGDNSKTISGTTDTSADEGLIVGDRPQALRLRLKKETIDQLPKGEHLRVQLYVDGPLDEIWHVFNEQASTFLVADRAPA